jgi:transposase-like protein
VVHLLHNSFRYAGRQHFDAIAKALRPICTAPTEAAAMGAVRCQAVAAHHYAL